MEHSRLLSVAPMMNCTDRHFRYFIRLMSRHTGLYTEMIPAGAIARRHEKRFLLKHRHETFTAAQFGGNNPGDLALSARAAERWGYNEVNLNAGCPSERVRSGEFGACLMKTPKKTGELLRAMMDATTLPVSIKIRIGVDELDSYGFLRDFIGEVYSSGCRIVIIHARKAWLKGLNPKQNRTIPPLRYDTVYQIKQDFPELTIVINGGIRSFDDVRTHVPKSDGIMIGRAAYENPLMFLTADSEVYGKVDPVDHPSDLVDLITEYMRVDQDEYGTGIRYFANHLLKFFRGMPGVARYRRNITQYVSTGQECVGFFRDFFDELNQCRPPEKETAQF